MLRSLINRRQLPWIMAAVLLLWIAHTASWANVWQILSRLNPLLLVLLVVLNLFIVLIQNGRWWLILYAMGYRLPYFYLTGCRLAALGLSYFTPGPLVGGEPLQAYLIVKTQNVSPSEAVASILLDKLLDLFVSFNFLAIGAIIVLQDPSFSDILGLNIVPLSIIPLTLTSILAGALLTGKHPISRMMLTIIKWLIHKPRWQNRFKSAYKVIRESEDQVVHFAKKTPWYLVASFVLTVLVWFIMLGEFGFMLYCLDIDLTVAQMIIALTAARFALLLLIPGGAGAMEASQVLVFSRMGFLPAAGISVGLLIRLRDVLFAGLGFWWGSRQLALLLKDDVQSKK